MEKKWTLWDKAKKLDMDKPANLTLYRQISLKTMHTEKKCGGGGGHVKQFKFKLKC